MSTEDGSELELGQSLKSLRPKGRLGIAFPKRIFGGIASFLGHTASAIPDRLRQKTRQRAEEHRAILSGVEDLSSLVSLFEQTKDQQKKDSRVIRYTLLFAALAVAVSLAALVVGLAME